MSNSQNVLPDPNYAPGPEITWSDPSINNNTRVRLILNQKKVRSYTCHNIIIT